MPRSRPTEEDLGLVPSEEELATSTGAQADATPTRASDDDDYELPRDTDDAIPEQTAQPAPAQSRRSGKTVPIEALHEERNNNKSLNEQIEATRRENALLQQRWNDFLQGQQAQREQPQQEAVSEPVIPTFEDDPIAAGKWVQEQLLERQKQERETATQTQQRQREEQQFQQAYQRINADFTASSQADPTVSEAYQALLKSQGDELLAYGYTIPQARQQMAQLERQHIMFAAQRGIPIGQYVKSLATARGWRPGAGGVAQPGAQGAPVGGQQRQPARQDLAQVAASQQRHQSLGDAPGGEAIGPLDAKALASMSDKDFKAWMSKKTNEDKFDAAMGKE